MESGQGRQTSLESFGVIELQGKHDIRQRNPDLDFRNVDNKYSTHRIHTYPAVMIGPVARYCIERYLSGVTNLLDPFVGSGSVLVEAAMKGIPSVGIDLNPLAVAISKARVQWYSPKQLRSSFSDLRRTISEYLERKVVFDVPSTITNWEFWYNEKILQDLLTIKNAIDNSIGSESLKLFFKVTLSEIIRAASYQRNGEFKRYRLPKEKILSHEYDVFGNFETMANYYINGVEEYMYYRKQFPQLLDPDVRLADSRYLDWMPDGQFDGLLTSPPYGDSQTTVAYGQFSRFSLELLDFDSNVPANQVDHVLLGGKKSSSRIPDHKIESVQLGLTLDKIREKDPKRANEVKKFFSDYFEAISEHSRVLGENSKLVYVVGNRTVKKVWVETDIITKEMFEQFGFKLKGIYYRDIPNKRMPSKNSPTNVKGERVTTMVNEYVVVMER
ncbi:MAG: DNA methyltransferase [Methanobacteriota archaeon]|nr:MAG: DNA methyltransferase [Euryarchaeota archaeon]